MECNKDEALRAKEIAEIKMANNDFEGAQRMALKAQNLYPELDNIAQMLSTCDVHCCAGKCLLGSEKDWYEILQLQKFADAATIKKQYRRLALILHPDKNRFPGAEGAFKWIQEANALLSDPVKKSLYDNKIRGAFISAPQNNQYGSQSNGSSTTNQGLFWTCCPFCKGRFQYIRQYMYKQLKCDKCSKNFIAHEVSVQGVSSGSKMGQQGPRSARRHMKTEETKNGNARNVGNRMRNRGKTECNDSSDTDREYVTTQQSFGISATDVRESSRKRNNAIYEETDEDGHARTFKREQITKEDTGKEQKGNESHIETIVIESDSERDESSSEESDADYYSCQETEFSDFEKVRDERNFGVHQVWACYDTVDDMPRFYAKVKKVYTSPFKLLIQWLVAKPIDRTYKKWIDEELPVGCGSFKLGETEETDVRLSFSHQICCEKGKKRGFIYIYPREGDVWAVFKDWDRSWSSNPENHKKFKFEIVEVLSDFDEDVGIKVCYLDKVGGFVSLFERPTQINSFLIKPDELYRFSHLVPCSKLTGNEKNGVPIGSFELDTASLPQNLDDVYYPSKVDRKMEKNAKGKGRQNGNRRA